MAKHPQAELKVESFADHSIITQPNPLRRVIRRVDDRDRDDPVERAEKALAGLAGEFKKWMRSECERLAAAHIAIIKTGVSAQTRDELFRAAHDIKGDAATFGYPSAAIAAESLCRIIEHAPDLQSVPSNLIAHHIHAIQAIIREQQRIGMGQVADELSNQLRDMADDYLTLVNRDRPEHLEAILGQNIAPGIVPAD